MIKSDPLLETKRTSLWRESRYLGGRITTTTSNAESDMIIAVTQERSFARTNEARARISWTSTGTWPSSDPLGTSFSITAVKRILIRSPGYLTSKNDVLRFGGIAGICGSRCRLPAAARVARASLLHCPANTALGGHWYALVVTIHDLIPMETAMSDLASRAWERSVSQGSARARKVVTPSSFTKGKIIESFRVPADNVVVNHWRPMVAVRRSTMRSASHRSNDVTIWHRSVLMFLASARPILARTHSESWHHGRRFQRTCAVDVRCCLSAFRNLP